MTARIHPAAIDPAPVPVADLATLVKLIQGTPQGQQVRVVGAGHSVPQAISVDAGRGTNITLGPGLQKAGDPYRPQPIVVGQGGMRLGGDPNENVPPDASFLWYLSHPEDSHLGAAYGVPDLGGITHQTLGGFLATGSSGGSLQYAFEDAVVSVSMIDGLGRQQTFQGAGGNGTLPIAAAGASLGLLGVITDITVKPVPRFIINGQESTLAISDLPWDPFASGPTGLASFLESHDYCRIMWWPQPDVQKFVTWTADQAPLPPKFVPKPYRELGDPNEDPATWPTDWPILAGNVIAALIRERQGLWTCSRRRRGRSPRTSRGSSSCSSRTSWTSVRTRSWPSSSRSA